MDSASEDCSKNFSSSGVRAELEAREALLDRAQRSADVVLLQDPKNAHATFAVALIHLHKDQPGRAKEMAQASLERGRGAPAHALLGVLALRDKDPKAAQISFDKALELDPLNVEARFNRAVLEEQGGDYNEARKGYLKTLSVRPGHADSRYALARMTYAAGAIDEARHHLRKLVEISRDDPRIGSLSKALRGEDSSSGIQGTVHAPGQ
jgi:tetratricopeptide (TPR) repeat protein